MGCRIIVENVNEPIVLLSNCKRPSCQRALLHSIVPAWFTFYTWNIVQIKNISKNIMTYTVQITTMVVSNKGHRSFFFISFHFRSYRIWVSLLLIFIAISGFKMSFIITYKFNDFDRCATISFYNTPFFNSTCEHNFFNYPT